MYYIVEFIHSKTCDYVPQEWMKSLNEAYWPRKDAQRKRQNKEIPDHVYSLHAACIVDC